MGDFAQLKLGDVIELKRGYDLPQSERKPGKYPIVSSSGITGDHCEPMVKAPGVVTGRYGTLGKVIFIDEDYWPLNTTLYVRDFKGNDPRFISYFLKSLDFNAYSDKAAVPGLNRNDLHQAPILFPKDLRLQRSIAEILGVLDNKIGLNQRTNATLEAMSQAIFKDWFIDFGPTRAKMEDKTPYLASKIWSLFPDRIDREFKPEGWPLESIGAVAEKVAMGPFGSNIKVETFVERGVPVVSGKHLFNTQMEDKDFDFISEEHAQRLSNSCVGRGDIVFTHAGNIGQVSIIPQRSQYQKYVLSQRQFYLRVNKDRVSPFFMIYFFKSLEGQHKLLANASQVGVPSISRPATNLRQITFVCPSKSVMMAFDEQINPIHSMISSLRDEVSALSKMRDLLLPKLMSGEIRLIDAEKAVEAVM